MGEPARRQRYVGIGFVLHFSDVRLVGLGSFCVFGCGRGLFCAMGHCGAPGVWPYGWTVHEILGVLKGSSILLPPGWFTVSAPVLGGIIPHLGRKRKFLSAGMGIWPRKCTRGTRGIMNPDGSGRTD